MSLDRGWRAVVCVASGPSFTAEQAALIERARAEGRARVMVVNDNYRRLPHADVLYACDGKWWSVHIDAVRAGFRGELWTQDEKAAGLYGLTFIRSQRGNDLPQRGDAVITQGSNSGFQAIMVARLFGASRIVLVGYDMQRARGGPEHWFGSHPKGLHNGDPRGFVRHFDAVAPALRAEGTEVVNCSAATALACFPRADLSETLASL